MKQLLGGGIITPNINYNRKLESFWQCKDCIRFPSDREVMHEVIEELNEKKKMKKAHERFRKLLK